MKNIILLSALSLASAAAFAGASATVTTTPPAQDTVVAVCDAAVAGSGKATVYQGAGYVFVEGTDAPIYVQQGFDAQCSANTTVSFREASTTQGVVMGVSTKGSQVFGGNSNGGAINALIKCVGSTTSNGACTDAEDMIDTNWAKAAS